MKIQCVCPSRLNILLLQPHMALKITIQTFTIGPRDEERH